MAKNLQDNGTRYGVGPKLAKIPGCKEGEGA
jgi:hypothetical protein